MPDPPPKILINENIDGLPVYTSSKIQLLPILFNIKELLEVRPMAIGIYCVQGKPSDLSAYLQPFVEEAKIILSEGIMTPSTN